MKKNTLKPKLFFIALTLILSVTIPVPTNALIGSVPVSDRALELKETGWSPLGIPIPGATWDFVIIFLVKGILEQMSNSVVTWINGGFDGNPAFITDPEAFFLQSSRLAANNFIQSIGASSVCSSFRTQVETALRNAQPQIRADGRLPRTYAGSCQINGLVTNLDAYLKGDFSQGGWDAWFSLTQDTTNNPYGAVLDAASKLEQLKSQVIEIEGLKLDWGNGALSWSECIDPGPGAVPCNERGPIKTPGTLINSQLEETLNSELDQLELADELDEIASAMVGQLVNRVFNRKGILSPGTYTSGSTGGTQIAGSLSLSCFPDKTSALAGEEVTWTVNVVSGTTTPPIITWSGTDGLSGSAKDAKITYRSAGTKTASVTVNNGTNTSSAACQQSVDVSLYPPMQVTCTVKPQTANPNEYVTWVATITGGSGQFITVGDSNNSGWGGTDNDVPVGAWIMRPQVITASGNGFATTTTITKPRYYTKTGRKTAQVTVVDMGDPNRANVTQACSDSVLLP